MKPWFSAIYEILSYKLSKAKDKARKILTGLVTDYERTGSLDKFIALEKGRDEEEARRFIANLVANDKGLEKITEEFYSGKVGQRKPQLTPDDKWLRDLEKLNGQYRRISKDFKTGKIDFQTCFQELSGVIERYFLILAMDDETISRFYSSASSVDEVIITRGYH